jgi:hypothetical protein
MKRKLEHIDKTKGSFKVNALVNNRNNKNNCSRNQKENF